MEPFFWSSGGKKLTPAQVAARQKIVASMLGEGGAPKNVGEGIHALGKGLFGGMLAARTGEAETAGRAGADEVFKALMGNQERDLTSLMGAASDPWLQNDPGKMAMISSMLGQEMQQQDPGYQLDQQMKQAQLAQLQNPDPLVVNGQVVDRKTFDVLGDYRTPEEPAAPKPTSDMLEYDYARSQGYEGSFTDYQTAMRQAGATNIDFNANQGTAAAYADRMASADQVLSDPALTSAMTNIVEQGKAGIPVAGNFLVSKEYQLAEQAQRDFVNAILRRESGAVISPSEFENAKKQYFPQPGDTQEVIEQKAANRRVSIEGVARAAGPNYQTPGMSQQPAGQDQIVDATDFFKDMLP